MPCFYLTPKQDDFNQERQICIAEALYDVDSIVADPGAYSCLGNPARSNKGTPSWTLN